MGPGSGATQDDMELAYELGKQIAAEGWVLLTGGRDIGVMDAASCGAREAGGLTIGILPGSSRRDSSRYVDIPIVTGMGSARNNINVLSSEVVIGCGTGKGTISEIMLALKAGKPVMVINQSRQAGRFFRSLDDKDLVLCDTPEQVIHEVKSKL